MKILIFAIFVSCFGQVIGHANSYPTGYWPLNDLYKNSDLGGYGHTAEFKNGVEIVPCDFCQGCTCASLGGTNNGYITIRGDFLSLTVTHNWTVMALIKTPVDYGPLYHFTDDNSTGVAGNHFWIAYKLDGRRILAKTDLTEVGIQNFSVNETWSWVGLSYRKFGDQFAIIVNGISRNVDHKTHSSGFQAATREINIGHVPGHEYLTTHIACFSIYSKRLTQDEIENIKKTCLDRQSQLNPEPPTVDFEAIPLSTTAKFNYKYQADYSIVFPQENIDKLWLYLRNSESRSNGIAITQTTTDSGIESVLPLYKVHDWRLDITFIKPAVMCFDALHIAVSYRRVYKNLYKSFKGIAVIFSVKYNKIRIVTSKSSQFEDVTSQADLTTESQNECSVPKILRTAQEATVKLSIEVVGSFLEVGIYDGVRSHRCVYEVPQADLYKLTMNRKANIRIFTFESKVESTIQITKLNFFKIIQEIPVPIGFWPFDAENGLNDISPYRNHAKYNVVNGNQSPTFVDSKSLWLGETNYVSLESTRYDLKKLSQWTIYFYVDTGRQTAPVFLFDTGLSKRFVLRPNLPRFSYDVDESEYTYYNVLSEYDTKNVQYVAVTANKEGAKLRITVTVDGSMQQTGAWSNLRTENGKIVLGHDFPNTIHWLNGSIACFYISPKKLSIEQISDFLPKMCSPNILPSVPPPETTKEVDDTGNYCLFTTISTTSEPSTATKQKTTQPTSGSQYGQNGPTSTASGQVSMATTQLDSGSQNGPTSTASGQVSMATTQLDSGSQNGPTAAASEQVSMATTQLDSGSQNGQSSQESNSSMAGLQEWNIKTVGKIVASAISNQVYNNLSSPQFFIPIFEPEQSTVKVLTSSLVVEACLHCSPINSAPPNNGMPNKLLTNFAIPRIAHVNVAKNQLKVFGLIFFYWNVTTCSEENFLSRGLVEKNAHRRVYLESPDSVWVPKFLFINSADDVFLKSRLIGWEVLSTLWFFNDSLILNFYYIKQGVFNAECVLNVKQFPFDKQQCTFDFVLENSLQQVEFGKIGFDCPSPETTEWEIIDCSNYTTSSVKLRVHNVQKISFKVILARRPTYYILNCISPLAMMSLLEISTLLIPADRAERTLFSVTLLLSQLYAHSVYVAYLPKSAGFVMMSFYILGIVFCSSLLAVYNAFIFWMTNQNTRSHRQKIPLYERCALALTVIGFAVLNITFYRV